MFERIASKLQWSEWVAVDHQTQRRHTSRLLSNIAKRKRTRHQSRVVSQQSWSAYVQVSNDQVHVQEWQEFHCRALVPTMYQRVLQYGYGEISDSEMGTITIAQSTNDACLPIRLLFPNPNMNAFE